jgi:hypothetical protein
MDIDLSQYLLACEREERTSQSISIVDYSEDHE